MIARILLIACALVAGAWCATGLRSALLEADARHVLAGGSASELDFAAFLRHATPERIRRAADLYEKARDWAPYQTDVAFEAGLLNSSGRHRQAVDLMEDLVRREPDNPDGWVALSTLLARDDAKRAAEARRRAIQLSPPVEPR